MKNFFSKNWVFISGLLAAVLVVLQQFSGTTPVDWKVIGLACGMAVLSYIGNQWRGQGLTVLGVVGTLCYTFVTVWQTGVINWNQFVLSAVIAILSLAVKPPQVIE